MQEDKFISETPQHEAEIHNHEPQSYGGKIVRVILLGVALMFAAYSVWFISLERQSSQNHVENQISALWGGKQCIQGPTIKTVVDSLPNIIPEDFKAKANVSTEKLHRGIFESMVYRANLDLSAAFFRDSILNPSNHVTIEMGINPKQISDLRPMTWNGKEYKWRISENKLTVMVPIDATSPEMCEFSASFVLKGSRGLFIAQSGTNSTITINGKSSNPSFQGEKLPDSRIIEGDDFSSTWKVPILEVRHGMADCKGLPMAMNMNPYIMEKRLKLKAAM